MQENSWSGLAGFFSSFSYAYGKLLKFDKVKSNAEFLIQSAKESSQEISGAVNPAYIMSTFLPVHTFGGFAIQFCCKPIFKKFRFSLKNLLCSMACTVSIFSAFKLPLFFPSNSLSFGPLSFCSHWFCLSKNCSGTPLYSNFSTRVHVQTRHSFLMCHLKDPKVMLAGM